MDAERLDRYRECRNLVRRGRWADAAAVLSDAERHAIYDSWGSPPQWASSVVPWTVLREYCGACVCVAAALKGVGNRWSFGESPAQRLMRELAEREAEQARRWRLAGADSFDGLMGELRTIVGRRHTRVILPGELIRALYESRESPIGSVSYVMPREHRVSRWCRKNKVCARLERVRRAVIVQIGTVDGRSKTAERLRSTALRWTLPCAFVRQLEIAFSAQCVPDSEFRPAPLRRVR